jgi:CMP-N,N'-diacetyllegionaminic acid synthase
MYTIGLIPCRSGSKRIPSKNMYPLNGIPLYEYTIKAALDSKLDDVVISSDSFNYVHKLCKFIVRPHELAKDDTPMLPVIQDVVETYEISFGKKVDAVCLLQPTSPLRTAEDINQALDMYYCANTPDPTDMPHGAGSLYSGYYMRIKNVGVVDSKERPRHFQRNGAIFIICKEMIQKGIMFDEGTLQYEMPFSRSVDIDTFDDMALAEALIKGGILNPKEVKT